ncbi:MULTISPECIES: folate family ECF transporter S component [unclassified Halanaerobium]|uniref:folate family ECF transporter S component n=1 Tax=unclassified Halanaerobium TaxID=2641197 RepID=UPI000DF30EEE|nr:MULTISPECIES: folate family ECF transporter S component [unclassified Halanaerobium]RCW49834.1 ECF transporter S component (folate family) [Halanaerobium sp. MA284_MarDTE_T2]RCW88478.1 ECF transporter S component (folate family) [Halanaerobium sp. DL-01]
MKITTKRIAYLSFLTALSIILTRILSIRIPIAGVEGVRIGFGSLPIIFAGVALGPLAGGIVGALADFLGYFINPMGAYMPHFTLTSFLTGFIPGVMVFYVLKRCRTLPILLISIAVGQIITSLFLVPYFINMLFAVPFKVIMPPRVLSQLINIPLYAYFVKVLFNYNIIKVRKIRDIAAGNSC